MDEYFNVIEHQRSDHNIIVLKYKYTLCILILNVTNMYIFIYPLHKDNAVNKDSNPKFLKYDFKDLVRLIENAYACRALSPTSFKG